MESQDLQLHRQVHLADVDARRDRKGHRREVQDAGDASGDQPVADVLRRGGRGRDDADRRPAAADDLRQIVDVAHRQAGYLLADALPVSVEQADHPKPAGGKPAVAGERMSEVAHPDEDNAPPLSEAKLVGDLVDEVLHVVPDAAGAVGPQLGQILAYLGRVNPGRRRQRLRGHSCSAGLRQRVQGSQVERQPGDGRLRDQTARRSPGRAGAAGPGLLGHGAPESEAAALAVPQALRSRRGTPGRTRRLRCAGSIRRQVTC